MRDDIDPSLAMSTVHWIDENGHWHFYNRVYGACCPEHDALHDN